MRFKIKMACLTLKLGWLERDCRRALRKLDALIAKLESLTQ